MHIRECLLYDPAAPSRDNLLNSPLPRQFASQLSSSIGTVFCYIGTYLVEPTNGAARPA